MSRIAREAFALGAVVLWVAVMCRLAQVVGAIVQGAN